jgi:glycosyltransferase involved in cell wall biosynthesis
MVAFMYPPKWYLGQSRGLKGHEDLIDAIAICMKQGANLLGVFVGGAWNNAIEYENRVRAYARKRCGNRIIFLGTRNDVKDLYPDMDVVVHASRSDNVGGAVESLLSMVPTVATNVGGFPDVVTPGETGWLVPARDPAALANAIMDVLVDPARAQDMARKGRERVLRLFRVEETSKQVLEIYRTILGLDRNN